MKANKLFLLTVAVLAFGSATSQAQSLFIQKELGGGCSWWWGSIQYYPAPAYPRPVHGRSLYAAYGRQRLEGRVLALPAGFSPPGPQALNRFTIATIGAPAPGVVAPAPVRPTRYPHPSYIRSNRHPGYSHSRY